jgi:hypothetical protein
MSSIFARHLLISLALMGFSWTSQGQISAQKLTSELNSAENLVQSIDSGSPANLQGSPYKALTELVSHEATVLLELRRGLDRLSKGCVFSSAPKSESENALFSRNILAFEEGSARVDARLDALYRNAALFEEASRRDKAQQCSALGLPLLKSPRCRQSEENQTSIKLYRTELERYYRLQSERYKTYLDLVEIEKRSCVRSGFSSRLVQANQVHMRESEEQGQRWVEYWNRELSSRLGLGGQRP